MLTLCLMLSGTYYAKNYAGIIGRDLFQAYRPLSVRKCARLSPCDGRHFGRQISIVRNDGRGYLGYFTKTRGASKSMLYC